MGNDSILKLPRGHDRPVRRRWRTKAPPTIRADGLSGSRLVIKRPGKTGKDQDGEPRCSPRYAKGGRL